MKVVIADDDGITRQILRNLLTEAGHEVIGEAKNGQDVVESCLLHQPDVLYLDIHMPMLSGFEALPQIRQACPSVHVVMISASSTLENVRQAAKMGVSGFLVKPFTPAKVLASLPKSKA
ncbi:response regulator transcription factor [Aquabacterium sp.]|uniref:response regulator transcription factor n=1 Tax=Aquabacterium sp. TaxID=1872578 RepID=UPI002E32E9F5|nr:response regulator [Aquabacterium sp.]HEX5312768.1 response regulator [Aquabacterium sp.]